MKHPLFNHWSETKYIKDIVTNPLIEVGEYSIIQAIIVIKILKMAVWYFGEYGPKHCSIQLNRWDDLDKLIIGNYVCIASG